MREAALYRAERLEVVVVVVRVGRRPHADRARRRGRIRQGRGGRGLVEVEVLADAADEGQVLVLPLVVVVRRAIIRRRGRRGCKGRGGGEVGGDLRDGGFGVVAGEDAGAAERIEVLL